MGLPRAGRYAAAAARARARLRQAPHRRARDATVARLHGLEQGGEKERVPGHLGDARRAVRVAGRGDPQPGWGRAEVAGRPSSLYAQWYRLHGPPGRRAGPLGQAAGLVRSRPSCPTSRAGHGLVMMSAVLSAAGEVLRVARGGEAAHVAGDTRIVCWNLPQVPRNGMPSSRAERRAAIAPAALRYGAARQKRDRVELLGQRRLVLRSAWVSRSPSPRTGARLTQCAGSSPGMRRWERTAAVRSPTRAIWAGRGTVGGHARGAGAVGREARSSWSHSQARAP